MSGDLSLRLRHRVQTGSSVHLISCLMATRDSFPGGKAAIRLPGVVLN
jgi:hypothetical protein